LDTEIRRSIEQSREGMILTSILMKSEIIHEFLWYFTCCLDNAHTTQEQVDCPQRGSFALQFCLFRHLVNE
jgi:hypothetical protein